jgi:hypothetical protein
MNLRTILFSALLLTHSALAQSQADLQILLSACQFFAGAPLTQPEQQAIAADLQSDFAKDPSAASTEIAQLGQLGAALSQAANPLDLVVARQQGLFAMYAQAANGKATPTTTLVLRKANPLAASPDGWLLLADDLQGATAFLSLLKQAQGRGALSTVEQQQFQSQVVANFSDLPKESKEFLVSGRVIWAIASQQVVQWNQQQQAQFAQSLTPPQNQQMSWDSYQMLSNMSRNQHMTTMNILENMGDSREHWEYMQRPSW